MATQPRDYYTLDDYLKLDEPDSTFEFHDGLIFPCEAASPTHARLESRLCSIFENSYRSCAVYGPSLNLYVASANKVFHPDVTVVCGVPNYPKPECIDNPTVLVEVTSPSTKDYDYGTKQEHYFSLPSVKHYLLVSQSEPRVSHYQRSGEAWIYVNRYAGEIIFLGEIEVNVNEVYRDILPEPKLEP